MVILLPLFVLWFIFPYLPPVSTKAHGGFFFAKGRFNLGLARLKTCSGM